jgi:hypothetical protein
MNKIKAILVIFLLLIGGITFYIPVTAISTQHLSKEITYNFSEIEITEQNSFSEIKIPETSTYTTNPGKPRLPTFEKTLSFPINTKINKISCSTKQILKQKISSKISLSPVPVPLNTVKISPQKQTYYENPHPFPDKWVEYTIGRGLINGERSLILKIQVNPIQYYPLENTIKKAQNIKININYDSTEEEPNESNFDEDFKLIILTPSKFKDDLLPLVARKLNRNISTKLVTLDEIYGGTYFPNQGQDEQEMIKYFIKNAYDQWETQYVLLVGSSKEFPARETHIFIDNEEERDDNEIIVSDLYYADIYDQNETFQTWDTNDNQLYGEYSWEGKTDQLDLFPDVYIGRLACINSKEVKTAVNKIINYEEYQSYKKSWFNNIVLIGGDTFPPIYDEISGVNEGEYANQQVLDVMQGFISNKIWASNGKLAGVRPTGVDRINDAINKGCGFIHFSGHGSSSVWTTYPHNGTRQVLPTPFGTYRSDHIESLQNGEKLPIVVSGACSVGKYQKNQGCFSWRFISSPDGGGIASFGATGLAYACLGPNVTDTVVEKLALDMFKAYKQDEARTVGEMWAIAINNYITPTLYSWDYKTLEEWQPFCDPSLALRDEYLIPSQPPDIPILSGPKSGNPGEEYTYQAVSTDPDRDDISYLFDWGDGTFSEWIGPVDSGEAVQAKNSWDTEAEYIIRVKARDENGYERNWSAPLSVSMSKIRFPYFPIISWLINIFFNQFMRFANLRFVG